MSSMETFKEWCREAFSFLDTYNFKEYPLGNDKYVNHYQVIYSRDGIKLIILGESYGTKASIHFMAPNGEEIPYERLAQNHEASKTPKNKRKMEFSQKEQIYFAAQFIQNNLKNVLQGDYTLLTQRSQQLAEEKAKNRTDLAKFLNDPEAQAKRDAIVAISEAGHAFKNKNYKKVVEILEPHIKYLPPKQLERLMVAKSKFK